MTTKVMVVLLFSLFCNPLSALLYQYRGIWTVCNIPLSTKPLSAAASSEDLNDLKVLSDESSFYAPPTTSPFQYDNSRDIVKLSKKINAVPIPIFNKENPSKKVSLVGSGPGSVDLLTLKAYSLLSDPSNCVISDRLVPPKIIGLVKGPLRVANKHPGCAEQAQEEIYRWVKEANDKNWNVVRLKIGDPFVFGRGGEEVLRFRSMFEEKTTTIDFVPGVSATLAAPLLAEIPVTHRKVSNRVIICTGYGLNGTVPDYTNVIAYHPEQTVVFVMAVGRLGQVCESMIIDGNYPPVTPVAIVEKAGWGEGQMRIVRGNLGNIERIATKEGVKAPATIIVGDAVNVLQQANQK